MMLMDAPWRVWTLVGVAVTWRLAKPADVRVVIDDEAPIPCTCTLKGFEPDSGLSVWVATPAEPLPLIRADGVEVVVGDMPDCCGGIEFDAVTAGFRCRVCGAVTHNPVDAVQGYCGRCRSFTGVAA
jgi:hypothetical protein